MPGAGATPVRCTCRAPEAALVAPAPGIAGIWQVSGTDMKRACAGYRLNQFDIHD